MNSCKRLLKSSPKGWTWLEGNHIVVTAVQNVGARVLHLHSLITRPAICQTNHQPHHNTMRLQITSLIFFTKVLRVHTCYNGLTLLSFSRYVNLLKYWSQLKSCSILKTSFSSDRKHFIHKCLFYTTRQPKIQQVITDEINTVPLVTVRLYSCTLYYSIM